MIPTKADDATNERYVTNIMAVYHHADYAQRARGRAWYPQANELAELLSEGNVRAGAGVIAALSANKAWELNVKLAGRAFNGDVSGHFKDALDKVAKILAGADPADVLPMSLKTGHFFRCIVDPSDPDAVVIDRHAHDVAVGERYSDKANRGLANKTRYATLAHAYREAARRVGEIPSRLQAITWVVQVDEYRWRRSS